MNRERIIYNNRPVLGEINQGSIFYGGVAEDYPVKDVWGLVITPRCDIANKKVPTYHYLPVVKFNDWLIFDFKNMFCDKVRKEYRGKLKSFLKENGFSEELLNTFSIDDIVLKISALIKDQKKLSRLADIDKYYSLACKYLEREIDSEFQELQSKCSQIYKKLLEDVVRNDISGFYLLEGWNSDEFYVVLLRDIKRVQKNTFFKIGDGIMYDGVNVVVDEKSDLMKLTNEEEMIYVETELLSPIIEHLLQMFFYNFGRIGVEDRPQNTLQSLLHKFETII